MLKFYYGHFTHPLELVTDSLGKHFEISKEKMAFWCDIWCYILCFGVLHVSSGELLLPIIYLNIIVIYVIKLKMFIKRKMFIINVGFIHWDKLIKLYYFSFFIFSCKQANIYFMDPNMKLLQQENMCSMFKHVLKGKGKEDSVKIHKSR